MKIANKVGGGARTNELGLAFEQLTSIEDAFNALPDFEVTEGILYYNGTQKGIICSKNGLYNKILGPIFEYIEIYFNKKRCTCLPSGRFFAEVQNAD